MDKGFLAWPEEQKQQFMQKGDFGQEYTKASKRKAESVHAS
jgi:hypothetical protein